VFWLDMWLFQESNRLKLLELDKLPQSKLAKLIFLLYLFPSWTRNENRNILVLCSYLSPSLPLLPLRTLILSVCMDHLSTVSQPLTIS